MVDEKAVQGIDTTLRGRFLPCTDSEKLSEMEIVVYDPLASNSDPQNMNPVPCHKLGISCSVFLPRASNLEITKASLLGVETHPKDCF